MTSEKRDRLPVFMAMWMILSDKYPTTLESDGFDEYTITIDAPQQATDEILKHMRRCADDTVALQWCDGNFVIRPL